MACWWAFDLYWTKNMEKATQMASSENFSCLWPSWSNLDIKVTLHPSFGSSTAFTASFCDWICTKALLFLVIDLSNYNKIKKLPVLWQLVSKIYLPDWAVVYDWDTSWQHVGLSITAILVWSLHLWILEPSWLKMDSQIGWSNILGKWL